VTVAKFNGLQGIKFDSLGSLIIVDTNNNAVRIVTNGIVKTLVGSGSVSGTKNGMGKDALLTGVCASISLNATHILVSEYPTGLLRMIKYEVPSSQNLKTTSIVINSSYIGPTKQLYSNLLPEASIYFARLKSTNGIAVTALIGLGFCESYWLITLLISESKKFKSKMYQIASAAAFVHAFNLVCYTIVLDYQISPYLLGDKQLGCWALICGVMGHVINILMYWFITIRLYMFMKVMTTVMASFREVL
jgi:hypothetical protein